MVPPISGRSRWQSDGRSCVGFIVCGSRQALRRSAARRRVCAVYVSIVGPVTVVYDSGAGCCPARRRDRRGLSEPSDQPFRCATLPSVRHAESFRREFLAAAPPACTSASLLPRRALLAPAVVLNAARSVRRGRQGRPRRASRAVRGRVRSSLILRTGAVFDLEAVGRWVAEHARPHAAGREPPLARSLVAAAFRDLVNGGTPELRHADEPPASAGRAVIPYLYLELVERRRDHRLVGDPVDRQPAPNRLRWPPLPEDVLAAGERAGDRFGGAVDVGRLEFGVGQCLEQLLDGEGRVSGPGRRCSFATATSTSGSTIMYWNAASNDPR